MSWLESLWRQGRKIAALPGQWIGKRKGRKVRLYRYEHVEDFPDVLQAHKLYIAGENGYFWAAAMVCPCGCRDVIELNLLKKVRPCWTVQEYSDGSVTLRPSVWRREGCRSHFVLDRGQIEWYRESSAKGDWGA